MTCLLINDQDGYKKLATIAKNPLGRYVCSYRYRYRYKCIIYWLPIGWYGAIFISSVQHVRMVEPGHVTEQPIMMLSTLTFPVITHTCPINGTL